MRPAICIYFMIACGLSTAQAHELVRLPPTPRIEVRQRIQRFLEAKDAKLEPLDLRGIEGLDLLFSSALAELAKPWPERAKVVELLKAPVVDAVTSSSPDLRDQVQFEAGRLLLEFFTPSPTRDTLEALMFKYDLWSAQNFFLINIKLGQDQNLETYYPIVNKILPNLNFRQKQILASTLQYTRPGTFLQELLLDQIEDHRSVERLTRLLDLASIHFAQTLSDFEHGNVQPTALPERYYSFENLKFAEFLRNLNSEFKVEGSRAHQALAQAKANAFLHAYPMTYTAVDRQSFFTALLSPGFNWFYRKDWLKFKESNKGCSGEVTVTASSDGKIIQVEFCQSHLKGR